MTAPGQLRYSAGHLLYMAVPAGVFSLGICASLYVGGGLPGATRAYSFAYRIVMGWSLLMMLPLVIEFVVVRHEFDDQGFTLRSLWGRRRRFAWSDVTALAWDAWHGLLIIRTSDGRTARVAAALTGLAPFAVIALAQIPPDPLGLEAGREGRAALQVMAAGKAKWLRPKFSLPSEMLPLLRRG